MRPSVLKIGSYLLRSLAAWVVYCCSDHMQLLLWLFFFLLMVAGHTIPVLALFVSLLGFGVVRVVQLLASIFRFWPRSAAGGRLTCFVFTGACRGHGKTLGMIGDCVPEVP